MPTLSIIIITRDRETELPACLKSILTQTRQPDEVIVVDDASQKLQEPLVREFIPNAIVVRNDNPLGVPGARNIGIRKSRGDYLIFIDDDATFGRPDVLEITERILDAERSVGILAFRIVNATTKRITPFEFPHKDLRKANERFETSYFVGAGHAIRREVFDKVGLLFSDYFYGLEESDFSWRTIQAGYSILYVPELLVYHRASPVARPSWRKVYFQTRNRIWFVIAFLPIRYALTHMLVWLPYFFVLSLRLRRLDVFFKAIVDGIKGIPDARKRRAVEKLSDRTIARIAALNGRLLY